MTTPSDPHSAEALDLDAIEARANAATAGPWEHGDRQSIAGVKPEMFGEGKCASCRHGDPSWVGKRDINGTRMLAHVHTHSEPWWNHGIFAHREDGSLNVVNDTDEYGYMGQPDAEFIAHARTDVPALVAAVRSRDAEVAELKAKIAAAVARLNAASIPPMMTEAQFNATTITDARRILLG